MELDRKVFLHALETAEPAVSTKDLLPALQQIQFTGSVVRACDGTIGIEAPLKTDFAGGVPGAVLIGFVRSLDSDTVKVTVDETTLTLASKSSRVKLPLEAAANLVWPFPPSNAEPEGKLTLDATWREALGFMMHSVTNNSTDDERRGVTFQPSKKYLNLYSTDGQTLSWAQMPLGHWQAERICAPGDFVKELLRLMPEGSMLYARDVSIEAEGAEGVRLYSRLFQVENGAQFGKVVQSNFPDQELLPLPEGFKEALLRAELLKDSKEGVSCKFTFVDKDLLVLEAESSLGDFKEELYLSSDHPLLAVILKPEPVLRGLEKCDVFAVSKRCLILNGPEHLTYLVSAYKA